MKSVITSTTLKAIIAGFDALEVDDRFIASSFRYSLDATELSCPIANLERLLSHHTNNSDYLSPELFNFACTSLALLTNASFESNPGLLVTCSHILKRHSINGALHDVTSQLINTSLTSISANFSDLSAVEYKAAGDILSNLHPAKLEGLLSALQEALTIHRKTGKHLSPKLYALTCGSLALITGNRRSKKLELLALCSKALRTHLLSRELFSAVVSLRDKLGAMPSAFNRTRPFTPAMPAPTPSPESISGDDIPRLANEFKPISPSVSGVPTPPYSTSPKIIPEPCEHNPLKRKAQEMYDKEAKEAAETLLTIIQDNAQKPA